MTLHNVVELLHLLLGGSRHFLPIREVYTPNWVIVEYLGETYGHKVWFGMGGIENICCSDKEVGSTIIGGYFSAMLQRGIFHFSRGDSLPTS